LAILSPRRFSSRPTSVPRALSLNSPNSSVNYLF
jgi:hypothetical protein